MSYIAIQELCDGPVDVVGDIHGEVTALKQLLRKLGYDAHGSHPDGRRLVFVGDLVDRGENSPAVIEMVATLMDKRRAQCVLGNHELNLILDSRKEGNGWFYPLEDDHDHAHGHFLEAKRPLKEQRQDILDWFSTLPLALERKDLRIVHACWHQPAVDALLHESSSVRELSDTWTATLKQRFRAEGLFDAREAEQTLWAKELVDKHASVPLLPATMAIGAREQTDHPIKALTSGLEQPTATPFFGGGKWRMTERVAWWEHYAAEPAVIFGHYWRWAGDEKDAAARSRGPNLFDGRSAWEWLGPRSNAMCVDYSAGLRWRERAAGVVDHTGLIAAAQWPERQIIIAS